MIPARVLLLVGLVVGCVPLADALLPAHIRGASAARSELGRGAKTGVAQTQVSLVLGHERQDPDEYTEVTHESWFDRMGDAITGFFIGIALIIFSIPVLWMNERRSAKMESLIALSQSSVRVASATTAKDDNRGTLVHISDGVTKAAVPVKSAWFDDVKLDGCLKLRSSVQVFQWVEHSKTEEKKDMVGGGKTKTTSYTYEKEWSSAVVNSDAFKNKAKYKNTSPAGLNVGVDLVRCARVEYGDAFAMPGELVDQLQSFQDAGKLLGASVKSTRGTTFARHADNTYYYPERRENPEIGDARVTFTYVAEGPATVLALQVESGKDKARDTFLPYRLFRRGLCGMSEEQEKVAAIKEATKSKDELAEEDQCCTFGPFACLCCACNLVAKCCTFLATPQIFHVDEGSVTVHGSFVKVKSENTIITWVLRLVGWCMMMIGLYLLFAPLLTFVDIIPFLGPLISTFGGALIFLACLLVTVAVSSLIICLAYLAYRPFVAFFWAFIMAVMVALPLKLIPMLQEKAKAS